jgi:hypothetical protein
MSAEAVTLTEATSNEGSGALSAWARLRGGFSKPITMGAAKAIIAATASRNLFP